MAPFLPYTPAAFFRSPLAGAPVDAAGTSRFRAFMAAHPDQKAFKYPVIRGVGTNKWGTVYAEAATGDPVWKLTGTVPKEVAVLKTAGFHAPDWLASVLTQTSDSPFVVLDRVGGFTVWAAKAKPGAGRTISVGAAGLFAHTSNGLDRRNPRSDSKLNFRSRGAIPDGMVIRRDLLEAAAKTGGDLGHVLHLFFVETSTAAGHVHPMVGHESGKNGWGAEGQRIGIDPGVDLSQRNGSPAALVIARTLQNYGAYLGDNAGSATSLKAEQDSAKRPVWGKTLVADALKSVVTWNDFIVVKAGWQA